MQNDRALPRSFYDRSTTLVARELLGGRLVREIGGTTWIGRIVETEAYVAHDAANHAYRGRTERNRSMFGRPGTLYVYRIHQVYCANAVTRPGQAVLLRAIEPITPRLANARGPGRLCRAFSLTRADDGSDLTDGPIRVFPRTGPVGSIVRAPRVGIARAVDRPLRFALSGNRYVSSPRPWRRRRPTA
ncbi:MAG: DNA-3-methyladenine glycosylase [Thermoplasmata archaeon]|nr:DNA-3-methyladenine glycosylase [Thermoplasmata archaeon]MCI4353880.1 DNA-3-methyladenine glycosylase [Thermoplasmata archaeon]